jgi:hypothetical protein
MFGDIDVGAIAPDVLQPETAANVIQHATNLVARFRESNNARLQPQAR